MCSRFLLHVRSLLPAPCPGVFEYTYVPRGNAARFFCFFLVAGSLLVGCSASMDTDGRRQFDGSLLPVPCSGVGEWTYVARGNASLFSFIDSGTSTAFYCRRHVRVLVNGPTSPGEMLVDFHFYRRQSAGRLFREHGYRRAAAV